MACLSHCGVRDGCTYELNVGHRISDSLCPQDESFRDSLRIKLTFRVLQDTLRKNHPRAEVLRAYRNLRVSGFTEQLLQFVRIMRYTVVFRVH